MAFTPPGRRTILSGLFINGVILDLNKIYTEILMLDGYDELEAKIKAGKELPRNPEKLVRRGLKALEKIKYLVERLNEVTDISNAIYKPYEIVLKPPIRNPSKIIGIGLNYRSHVKEADEKLPKEPVVFSKASSSIIGPYDPIILPKISSKVDYEGELAIVIGAKCKDVDENEAFKYILGYMAANDVTARDIEFRSPIQFFLSKSIDTFLPIGPGITFRDHIHDPNNLKLITKLNGEIVQNACTGEMLFKVNVIVSKLSSYLTLLPGDIILTGTPSGVGFARNPPRYLRKGDVVEVSIENVGVIRNRII